MSLVVCCISCFHIYILLLSFRHLRIQVFPFFHFFLLDSSRKIPNIGVYSAEVVEPSFKLPPGLRSGMVVEFLIYNKRPEKLKNWHSRSKTTLYGALGFVRFVLQNWNHITLLVNDNHKQQLNQPKFQCDQCSKTFKSKSDLIRYVESVHYQERFECTGCDLSFSRSDNLEVLRLKQHQ